MDYFILQANKKLVEGQHAYGLPGLKDDIDNNITMLRATDASVINGLLEWRIPNNRFNQNWVSLHYSGLKILPAGEEQTFENLDIPLMANMPALPEPKDPKFKEEVKKEIKEVEVKEKKLLPMEIKKLKDSYIEKLKAINVEIPIKATLKILQALYEESK